jgi:hypothetical protein
MKFNILLKFMIFLACIFLILSLEACRTVVGGVYGEGGTVSRCPPPVEKVDKKAPLPHAPAHGHRAKYNYRYYPVPEVYFDVQRRMYFYFEGDNWKMSASLPRNLHLELSNFVNIEMDTARPYVKHKEHKRKYPPGKFKKYENDKKNKHHPSH